MPANEHNDKIARYREHRQMLTRFSEHAALAPKYGFFSELVLLWLDAKPDQEEKLWAVLMYYMGAGPRRKGGREEYEESDFTEESSIDRAAKEKMSGIVNDFLREPDGEQ